MLKYRLADAKRRAAENVESRAKLAANYPGAAESFLDAYAPLDWRVIARASARRRYVRPTIWNPPHTDDTGQAWRWLERVDGSGLRVALENATADRNRNTTGYYVDTFQDESQHGAVLSTRDPESPGARFFPAISDPHNAGAYRVAWESYDDASDAAAVADSLAERDAERQREWNAAWQAGSAWAEAGEAIKAARRDALAILRDRKAASGSATLCAVIREKVDSLLATIRAERAKRARLASGQGGDDSRPYLGFYDGDAELRSAFNEGAGAAVLPA